MTKKSAPSISTECAHNLEEDWSLLDFNRPQRDKDNDEEYAGSDGCQQDAKGTIPHGLDLCASFMNDIGSTNGSVGEVVETAKGALTAKEWKCIAGAYDLPRTGGNVKVVERCALLCMSGKMPVYKLGNCECFQEWCKTLGISFPTRGLEGIANNQEHKEESSNKKRKRPKQTTCVTPQDSETDSAGEDWKSNRSGLSGDQTLRHSVHSLYHQGYWLDVDDICFVMSAMLGDVGYYAPTAYDNIAGSLASAVAKKSTRRGKGTKPSGRWEKWTTQVTNCGVASSSGYHWTLTSTKFSTPPEAIVWEPLSERTRSTQIVAAFEKTCGKGNVPHHLMSHQSDGWSCGYIVAWWVLHQHAVITDGGECLENPPKPPIGWTAAVWLMLEARDAGCSAFGLGLTPLLRRAWEGQDCDFITSLHNHIRLKLEEY